MVKRILYSLVAAIFIALYHYIIALYRERGGTNFGGSPLKNIPKEKSWIIGLIAFIIFLIIFYLVI